VYHSLKSVIEHFKKQYTERDNGEDKPPMYDDVHVTPINSEKYIMFEIGKLPFIDSFQFLCWNPCVHTVEKRQRQMRKHAQILGRQRRPGLSKFDETELLSIESIHDTLNDEPLPPEDYERAKAIWKHLDIGNMRQYHDHYLSSFVRLLADVFFWKFPKFRHGSTQTRLLILNDVTVTCMGMCLKTHRCKTGSADWPRRISYDWKQY